MPDEAKAIALDLIRRRLSLGWTRDAIAETTFEGGHIPDVPAEYLMRAGKIAIDERMPWPPRGDEHSFGIRTLIDEIDTPQAVLFA